MFQASMREASTSATAQASACSRMRGASSSRLSGVNFLESSRPTIRRLGLRITAAATTGPNSAPRPASSMPAMRVQPSCRAARSKRDEHWRAMSDVRGTLSARNSNMGQGKLGRDIALASRTLSFPPILRQITLRRRGKALGPVGNKDLARAGAPELGCIQAALLPPPPGAGRFSRLGVREPVLPQHRPHSLGRSIPERVRPEKGQDIFVVQEQLLLGAHHKGIFAPTTERGKPQVPLEARLVGSVNAGSFVDGLRFVAERVRRPVLPVVRTLKFNFVTRPGHAPEQA